MIKLVFISVLLLISIFVGELKCQDAEQCVSEGSCTNNPNQEQTTAVCDDQESKQLSITFINNYHRILSLHWIERPDAIPHLIELGVEGNGHKLVMKTHTGHRFRFTRPGTHVLVGEIFVINNCQTEYVIPAQFYGVHHDGSCFDTLPEYCQAISYNCEVTPGWMVANCPKTCQMCDIIERKNRCTRKRLNISEEPWIKPGELHNLFEGMVERGKEFAPNVVSREPEGPWMIVFDNFVNDEEIEAFLKWGKHYNFARSTDTGPSLARGQNEYIVSRSRTSTNCWCAIECKTDPIIVGVYDRVEKLILAPRSHYEDFQLLKYEVGQFYGVHHDMNESPEYVFLFSFHKCVFFFVFPFFHSIFSSINFFPSYYL
ncbi:hypothetical protein M1146_03510 [Patescibacteria group bacterium]|nr:hypothetical protein [Patescibacteria group bacterium]